MKRQTFSYLVILAALALGARLEAATVWLQPSPVIATPGSSLGVELWLDATDAPGAHPGLYGGEVVVDFDPSLLAYDSVSLATGVSFFSGPTVGTSGSRQTVTFGFENATDVGRVGTLSYTALGVVGSEALINLADADDFFGSFVAYVPTDQAFFPNFVGTRVQFVPLPGTVLLLLTGIAALAARARRVARSQPCA